MLDLIGEEAQALKHISQHDQNSVYEDVAVGLAEWEEHLLQTIESDMSLADTEKMSVVLARRGQGAFKQNLLRHEHQCRVTGVARLEHLRASHIKPWRNCDSPEERLSGTNGLLLTPTIDHLFDRGFISFENHGEMILSEVTHKDSLRRMGVDPTIVINVGKFSSEQEVYLEYHRNHVFLEARIKV
jgi:predicted restriction endonuclease